MADFSGVLNPKRVINKREEAASAAQMKMPDALSPSQAGFVKPFSPEEKAKQNRELARILAMRK